jgi:putative flippase GtrA
VNRLSELVTRLLKISIVRYFIMAVVVVGIELASFALINSALGIHYLIATPVSMAIGIVLNWYFSKKFVFTGSRHKSHVEFTLVLLTSL